MNHPIESVMQTTLNELKQMVDVNTIIGKPVTATEGTTIIPISKVSFGFVSGGGQYDTENYKKQPPEDYPFAGGSGAGVSLNPVAFLVVNLDGVSLIPATFETPYDRIVEMLPNVIASVKKAMKKDDNN